MKLLGVPLNLKEQHLVDLIINHPGISVFELQRETETQQNRAINHIRSKWGCTCKLRGKGRNILCSANQHIYCLTKKVGIETHSAWYHEYTHNMSQSYQSDSAVKETMGFEDLKQKAASLTTSKANKDLYAQSCRFVDLCKELKHDVTKAKQRAITRYGVSKFNELNLTQLNELIARLEEQKYLRDARPAAEEVFNDIPTN
jgi:hypothetical protein